MGDLRAYCSSWLPAWSGNQAGDTPLCIGTVKLEDGTDVKGFLCEGHAVEGAVEITELSSWRTYLSSVVASVPQPDVSDEKLTAHAS